MLSAEANNVDITHEQYIAKKFNSLSINQTIIEYVKNSTITTTFFVSFESFTRFAIVEVGIVWREKQFNSSWTCCESVDLINMCQTCQQLGTSNKQCQYILLTSLDIYCIPWDMVRFKDETYLHDPISAKSLATSTITSFRRVFTLASRFNSLIDSPPRENKTAINERLNKIMIRKLLKKVIIIFQISERRFGGFSKTSSSLNHWNLIKWTISSNPRRDLNIHTQLGHDEEWKTMKYK